MSLFSLVGIDFNSLLSVHDFQQYVHDPSDRIHFHLVDHNVISPSLSLFEEVFNTTVVYCSVSPISLIIVKMRVIIRMQSELFHITQQRVSYCNSLEHRKRSWLVLYITRRTSERMETISVLSRMCLIIGRCDFA